MAEKVNSQDKVNGRDGGKDIVFRVLLYNDRFNKRERVSSILKNIASMEEKDANDVMMKAHRQGWSVIREFPATEREQAKNFCEELRAQDILVEALEVDLEVA